MFGGCARFKGKIYHPARNCRMNEDGDPFCPVCYTHLKKALYPYLKHNFNDAVSGDFSGDGKSEALIHNEHDLAIYRQRPLPTPPPPLFPTPTPSPTPTPTPSLDWAWGSNNVVPAVVIPRVKLPSWSPAAHDKYFVGDFDGDKKDDVFVFNDGSDWAGVR